MYNPEHFQKTNQSELLRFIQTYNFATLVSTDNQQLQVSHLPLLIEAENSGANRKLLGHMARANPHWKSLDSSEVLCIFHGPHGYISPSWYVNQLNVPTWNYAVVHVRGLVKLLRDETVLESVLTQLVDFQESGFDDRWQYDLPSDFRSKLTKAIVGFEINISSIEGKFKLSQNRSEEDWKAALAGVEKHYGQSNPELVTLMTEEFQKKR